MWFMGKALPRTLTFSLGLLALSSLVGANSLTSLSIENLVRNVQLSEPQNVRESVSLVIKNSGSEPAQDFFFTLDEAKNSSLSAYEVQTKTEKIALPVQLEHFDEKLKQQFWSVKLSPPLRPDGKMVINFKFVFLQSVVPFPSVMTQTESPSYKLTENVYFSSPYPSKAQKIIYKLPSSKVNSYTSENSSAEIEGNMITYGPYSDLPRNPSSKVSIHFPHSSSILYAQSVFRDLEVSHWGNNLGVEEHYVVQNHGPRFEGEFSRLTHTLLEYQRKDGSFVKDFEFELPRGAFDAYFRDEIGNVSTSNFRTGSSGAYLRLEPRYPIYGGWNYTWNHGYNVPLSSFLKSMSADPKTFILTVPFLQSLSKVPALDVTFRIVLPEGATDVEVISFPVDNYEMEFTRHYTYFDTVGRPTISIHRNNVVKRHWKNIEIKYTYEPKTLLLKPLVIFAALMLCFVSSMIFSRVNLHLGSTKFKKQK